MSIRSVLSFLAALVLGAGAACDAGPPSGAPEHLRVGQMLLVRLTASPATGYAWTFVGPLPPALRMERDPAPVPADRARPGAPAVQSWAFRAAQPGTYGISLSYAAEPGVSGGVYSVFCGDQTLRAEVVPTEGPYDFAVREIGGLEIPGPGTYTLTVRAENIRGGYLMNLQQVVMKALTEEEKTHVQL